MTTKTTRRNKRQEYINELEFDIDRYQGIADSMTGGWRLGKWVFPFQARKEVKELQKELQKVQTDKTYKPWVGDPNF
jgi:hypothetical protein